MTIRGSDSLAANVARRRQALSSARKSLGLGTERGAPQAPNRTPTPPPQLPARAQEPAPAPAQQQEGGDERRQRLLQIIESQKQGITRRGAPQEEAVQPQAAAAAPEPLARRASELGGEGLSAEAQFYRVAGRLPSPQEVSIFRARLLLEDQLQRPPTARELRSFILRPQSVGPSVPAVVGS